MLWDIQRARCCFTDDIISGEQATLIPGEKFDIRISCRSIMDGVLRRIRLDWNFLSTHIRRIVLVTGNFKVPVSSIAYSYQPKLSLLVLILIQLQIARLQPKFTQNC